MNNQPTIQHAAQKGNHFDVLIVLSFCRLEAISNQAGKVDFCRLSKLRHVHPTPTSEPMTTPNIWIWRNLLWFGPSTVGLVKGFVIFRVDKIGDSQLTTHPIRES